ncbi:hypothetical protein Pla123a_44230 [Posidoniimonas polymericola]|uniref:DUF1571 domain-containing protein n=1 Tax=Posidoniimonas polymericola TaxID=2528002 RepID=A0A5C5XVR3_9BACT|nr:DUF1571 domain-containing protein [Posidoniimonas polymericola]TWT66994.1 hypothetical protein Pla123a_44230 [Posidoniimonas polymericola]
MIARHLPIAWFASVALLAAPPLAADSPAADTPAAESPDARSIPSPEEHPLRPLLRMAQESQEFLKNDVRDYTCTMVMRERRNGRLKPYHFVDTKIRHADPATDTPFSAYLSFQKPASVAGREVLYLKGRNAGKMLVRRGGRRLAYVTTYLDPDSPIALEENRYPVSEMGFLNLIDRLVEVMQEDMQHGECTVQFFKNAKIGDAVCTRVIVEHPFPRDYFRYHRAMVFIDEQTHLPLAYGSYLWPDTPGGEPVLVEEYMYTDVKLNVGLTDKDFDRENPAYQFLDRGSVAASQE